MRHGLAAPLRCVAIRRQVVERPGHAHQVLGLTPWLVDANGAPVVSEKQTEGRLQGAPGAIPLASYFRLMGGRSASTHHAAWQRRERNDLCQFHRPFRRDSASLAQIGTDRASGLDPRHARHVPGPGRSWQGKSPSGDYLTLTWRGASERPRQLRVSTRPLGSPPALRLADRPDARSGRCLLNGQFAG